MTESNQKEVSQRTDASPLGKQAALLWYGAGTILLALYVGTAAGLSASPVVDTLLPLLFGLLGGAGGLYLARADLDDPAVARRTKIVGIYIVLFALSVAAGSAYGIALRTGVGIRGFLPSWSGPSLEPKISLLPPDGDELVDPAVALELGALRYRLRSLGFSRADEKRVLQSARRQVFPGIPEIPLVTELRKTAVATRSIGDYFTGGLESPSANEKKLAERFWQRMDLIAEDLDAYAAMFEKGETVNVLNFYDAMKRAVSTTRWLEENLGATGQSGLPTLFLDDFAFREKVRELRLGLLELAGRVLERTDRDWMTGTELTKQLDRLIVGNKMGEPASAATSSSVPYFEVPP